MSWHAAAELDLWGIDLDNLVYVYGNSCTIIDSPVLQPLAKAGGVVDDDLFPLSVLRLRYR